jgi:hypothetical protein
MQISKPIGSKDLRIGYYIFSGSGKTLNNKKDRGEIIPYNWDYKLKTSLRLFGETEDIPILIPTNIFTNRFLKSNFDFQNYREFVESIFIDMSYECINLIATGTCLEMTTLTIKDNIYAQLAINQLFSNVN